MSNCCIHELEIDTNLIDRAIEIERLLGKYNLWANMIPRNSWYANLRNILPKNEWDTIRKLVYKHFNYQCSICKRKGQLHAHESWIYDYKKSRQTLQDILALCYLCHMSQHLGYVQVKLIPTGELTMEEIEQHWMEINNKSKEEFKHHKYLAFELWEIRSLISWKVYDQNGILLSEL
jgi:hypothetical protein